MTDLTEWTMTTGDVARRLGVSVTSIQRYAEAGLLPSVRMPTGRRRFRPADIDAHIAQIFGTAATAADN